MGLKLDWRGFFVAAGASVMATSFSELPAVLVQQETGRSFEPPGDTSRIVGDPDVIQMGIVQISIAKSACGKSQLRPLSCGPKDCRFERWLDIPTMRSHVARTMALPPRPEAGVRSNFSPIQEVDCTACVRVSDTRCGTCVILPALLQSRRHRFGPDHVHQPPKNQSLNKAFYPFAQFSNFGNNNDSETSTIAIGSSECRYIYPHILRIDLL
jgi:hypothetical protein